MFPKGDGFDVLDEDPEEFHGRFAEIFFDDLLDVDDESMNAEVTVESNPT